MLVLSGTLVLASTGYTNKQAEMSAEPYYIFVFESGVCLHIMVWKLNIRCARYFLQGVQGYPGRQASGGLLHNWVQTRL